MWGFITNLLGIAGGSLKEWVAGKARIEEKKVEARIQRVANGIPGWTDELLVVIWSYPAVACFVPFLQDSAAVGISNFAAMPEWYQVGFWTVTAAVFGIDKLFRFKK